MAPRLLAQWGLRSAYGLPPSPLGPPHPYLGHSPDPLPFPGSPWSRIILQSRVQENRIHLNGNKNIVILGIIGKLSFSAIFIAGMLSEPGKVPFFFLIPVFGDLVFVVLFWRFLTFARQMGR